MSVVREIVHGENVKDLINEIKGRTYETGKEHALVTLANGQRTIVSGGTSGITFAEGQIKRLFGHSHPTSAPPSADDFEALEKLQQSQQTVLHGGEATKIRRGH